MSSLNTGVCPAGIPPVITTSFTHTRWQNCLSESSHQAPKSRFGLSCGGQPFCAGVKPPWTSTNSARFLFRGILCTKNLEGLRLCRYSVATATRTSGRSAKLVRRSLRVASASCRTAPTRERSACASNSTAASGEVSCLVYRSTSQPVITSLSVCTPSNLSLTLPISATILERLHPCGIIVTKRPMMQKTSMRYGNRSRCCHWQTRAAQEAQRMLNTPCRIIW